jgi:hypothetical protein
MLVLVVQIGCASMAIGVGSHIVGDIVSDKIKDRKSEEPCGRGQ